MCSDFLRKSTARWSKLHSTSTDDPAEKEEQLSWKTHNILSCFVISSVKFTEIGENFMHGCKNCILHVQTNNSKKIWCLGESLLFLSLLNFNQNLFGVLAKKYGTVVKTAFHVYRWSCRERRTNLLNNTWIFIFFLENSSVKFTEFDGEASCTVVKTAFYMYEGTIREKFDVGEKKLLFLSLSKFNQKMFGVFAEKFRHAVQNCLSRLQMFLPRKTNKSLE